MTTDRLCQIVAVQKGLQQRTLTSVTEVYHNLQKAQLFNGLSRKYTPTDDDGEALPPESTPVQLNVETLLSEIANRLSPLIDVVATKETANMTAKAPVVLDGVEILGPQPVPFLLFLEKQLIDLRTVLSKAPVLDPSERWTAVSGAPGSYRTDGVKTIKTKKVPEVLVKYPATDKHPAQTEMITSDKTVGTWETTKFSCALTPARRAELVARIDAMSDAVKRAREEANSMEVQQVQVASDFFLHLLG